MEKKIKDDQVRWGIIGVGDVCEVKSAPAMNLIEHSKVEAVMRRDATKAADYARRHAIEKWYSDADRLINDPAVNAIYIATPPVAHAEYTEKAAKAGKPIYVEKPMARTYEECQQMIQACEAADVPLYAAYYRRTLPHFLKVKELIAEGAIGQIRSVEVSMRKPLQPDVVAQSDTSWRVRPEIAGGGYFYDLASHQLDYLDFLFGPIQQANGFSANQAGAYPAEDIVVGSFIFENGVLGTGSWCFTTGNCSDEDMTIIIGSEGEISYESFGKGELTLRTNEKGTESFTFDLPTHIQQPMIQQVVNDLLGKEECVSTGESAARTNLIMEQLCRREGLA